MLDILYNRRSTRKFMDKKIEETKIKDLLTAALLAPSSKGSRPWEFIIVDDPALLAILATSKPHGASLLKHAPLAIIITGIKLKATFGSKIVLLLQYLSNLKQKRLDWVLAGYRSTVGITMTISRQMNISTNTLISRINRSAFSSRNRL